MLLTVLLFDAPVMDSSPVILPDNDCFYMLTILLSGDLEYLPTGLPSGLPTGLPSGGPTGHPSGLPSVQQLSEPTGHPFSEPSGEPTEQHLYVSLYLIEK